MADITQGRYQQLVKKVFGLKGGDATRQVLNPVQTSYELQDTYRPEDRASRGERVFGMGATPSNVAATSFGAANFCNPAGSGKICVIKRATWSLLLPTAANQPGVTFLSIGAQGFGTPSTTAFLKDTRWTAFGGAKTSSGFVIQAVGTFGSQAPISTYYVAVFPGAATVPFIHQVDNLDMVLVPNSSFNFLFASDTNPVGTYTWNIHVEGYERVGDPNELLSVAA